jgi:hypothetical protein
MMDRLDRCRSAAKRGACAMLLAGLLWPAMQAQAATVDSRAKAAIKARAALIDNLALLAQNRPRKCLDDQEPMPAAPGWRQGVVQCAWQNRLQMRRWEAGADADPLRCVSSQAQGWAWLRARFGRAPQAAGAAWNAAWPVQSLQSDSDAQQRVAIIARSADGSWKAAEWTWTPSPRAATRRWQAARWKMLTDIAADLHQAGPLEGVPHQATRLRAVWEKNLQGRPAEIAGERWQWESGGVCLRMETVGLSQAQLHLPYSKDDGRLEQRAAMQVQLARTYPKATWLTPFRLVPPADPRARGGAKFEAIWIEGATLKGQLWIPTKTDGVVVRARIVVPVPRQHERQPESPAVAQLARVVERELGGLASIWTADYER